MKRLFRPTFFSYYIYRYILFVTRRRQHEHFPERKLERPTERVRAAHRRRARHDYEEHPGIGVRSSAVRIYFPAQLTHDSVYSVFKPNLTSGKNTSPYHFFFFFPWHLSRTSPAPYVFP